MSTRPRIHYHTDCDFFAGCENMLVNFWGSSQLRQYGEISFSYRANPAYTSGLNGRVNVNFPIYPLKLPNPSWIDSYAPSWPRILRRMIRFITTVLLTFPMFLYDVSILSKLFRRIRPQILHINNGGYPAALSCRAAALAAKLCGIRNVVMVVNNLAVPYTAHRWWVDYPLDRLVARSVSVFVTGSHAAAARLRQVLRLSPKQVVPLHNGTALRRLTETAEQTRQRLGLSNFGGVLFGVVALMERRKGHRVILEAMVHLVKCNSPSLPSIKLVFEGDGPMRGELERFVAARGLGDWIRFVGEEDNVFNFMQALDVLVLPSIDHEDFPNVILEAMALGKPVIASHLAGTPEQVVNGVTGLLVPPEEPVALADALVALARDPLFLKILGANGSQRFKENFTAEISVSRYLRLYQEMIGA